MSILFAGEFSELISLTFFIFDFDGDERISEDDIRAILSFIPINSAYLEKRLRLETLVNKQQHIQGPPRKPGGDQQTFKNCIQPENIVD